MNTGHRHFEWSCPRSCNFRVERRSRRNAELVGSDHMSRRHGIKTKVRAMEMVDTDANAAAEMSARVRVMIEKGAPESVQSAIRAYRRNPEQEAKNLPKGVTMDDLAPRATAVTPLDLAWRRRAKLAAYGRGE